MKTIIINTLLLLTSILDCMAFNYRITADVDDPSLEGLKLQLLDNGQGIIANETSVSNGKIVLEGESDRTFPAVLRGQPNDKDLSPIRIFMIVEPGETVLDFKNRAVKSGGPLNEQFIRISREYRECADVDQIKALLRKTVERNPGNGLGEYALINLSAYCSPDEWTELVGIIDEPMKKITGIEMQTQQFDIMRRTWVGKPFAELVGKKADGTETRLSDYVGNGKYVLADFWSSWCGGCIIEAESFLIPLYNEYKDRPDFTLVGITVSDKMANSLEAAEKHGLTWPQIFESKAPMSTYGCFSIPQVIIFGPDGTILARNIHGHEIKKTLDSLLPK